MVWMLFARIWAVWCRLTKQRTSSSAHAMVPSTLTRAVWFVVLLPWYLLSPHVIPYSVAYGFWNCIDIIRLVTQMFPPLIFRIWWYVKWSGVCNQEPYRVVLHLQWHKDLNGMMYFVLCCIIQCSFNFVLVQRSLIERSNMCAFCFCSHWLWPM
jgi:hypothetical protein